MTTSPILLSMGDPAGVGGEITLKAWSELKSCGAPFAILADPDWLRDVARATAFTDDIIVVDSLRAVAEASADGVPVFPLGTVVRGRPGNPDPADASLIEQSIRQAVSFVKSGEAAGIVTNPINKKVLYDAGFSFPGHTEYIASMCGVSAPVMMLASPRLRVVPVTIHVPLRDAIEQLTTESIVAVARDVEKALRRDFAVSRPRLAISGLNPHAGEQGALGREDDEIIGPAIKGLRADGLDVAGPVPGDALFTPRMRETYDAAICMYHDQALIPIKALDFDEAVNVTLGLPIVRTSPDHGTAYDIAGKGIASPASLIAAIRLASEIAANRQRHGTHS